MKYRFRVHHLFAPLLSALVAGCATAPPEPALRSWDAEDLTYLTSPLVEGTGALSSEAQVRVRSAYAALRSGDPEPTRRLAAALDAATSPSQTAPPAAPALPGRELDEAAVVATLAGQLELLLGDASGSIARLAPVVTEFPRYAPPRLALGRAYDRNGDLVAAYEVLSPLAVGPESTDFVRRRVGAMEPEVVAELQARVEDSLRRGDRERARQALVLLQRIAPTDLLTYEAARGVAAAEGDEPTELQALRALALAPEFESESLRRLADLELSIGEAASAMQAFETLLTESPGDPELIAQLERAKFRWRLQLLPREVGELSQLPVLSRGDFAALTYWLVPTVRRGASMRAKIANDVLDHPMRDEIVRVVNMGLMDVDPVHRFHPERPVRGMTVLRTYLEVIARARPSESCAGASWSPRADTEGICGAAVTCGLIETTGDCRPLAEVSGVRAVELGRAALEQLGAP